MNLKIPGVCDTHCLESLSVLLSQSLPDKVMLVYISYPLCFFRCNIYGHVAAVCRTKIPRCGKCAGGHGIEDCVVPVDKIVCQLYG